MQGLVKRDIRAALAARHSARLENGGMWASRPTSKVMTAAHQKGETLILKILIPYLIVLNFIGFWSMRADKRKAMTHRHRTPEKRLFTYAMLGGSAGCLLGMKVYRHKTKHRAFTWGMPIILLLQILIIVLGYCYLNHLL